MLNRRIFFITVAVLLLGGCRSETPPNINLEQTHNLQTQHIIAPDNGTIGIISNGAVDMYYHDNKDGWVADQAARFLIPENNKGILSMGMGTIGVVIDDILTFFRIDAFNQWQKQELLGFKLPKRYDRLVSMHMPWEIGVLGVEHDGMVDFYFFYDGEWHHDPTSRFTVPSGITSYYPTGDMTIAIVDKTKLGLYFLGPEDGWTFMDHDNFILRLHEDYKGIIPMGKSRMAVLEGQSLNFYALDLENDRWVVHSDLKFDLPF